MVYIKHRRQALWMPRISKDKASRHGGIVKSSEGLEVQGINSIERMDCQTDCPLFWDGEMDQIQREMLRNRYKAAMLRASRTCPSKS